MKKSLLDVLFMSDIRTNVLLLLQYGPMGTGDILRCLGIPGQVLVLQMEVLEDHCLISHKTDPGESYELTTIGKLVVDRMAPLVRTLEVLDANEGYWENHRLDFLPRDLLERLGELGSGTVNEPRFSELYELDRTFEEECRSSGSFVTITNCLPPAFFALFLELQEQGTDMKVILSRETFNKARSEQYNYLRSLVKGRQTDLYLYPQEMQFLAFMENDRCMEFMLLTYENYYDNKQFMSYSPDALYWGREFFEHYRKDSLLIEEI